jgi:hypothetical protein
MRAMLALIQSRRLLAYGRALLAIRKEIASDKAFHTHLKKNGLLVRDNRFRADAIWLAENWDGFGNSRNQCSYANPGDIRKWHRQHGPQAADAEAKPSKPVD